MLRHPAFFVEVTTRVGGSLTRTTHNFETLPGAQLYANGAQRKPNTARTTLGIRLDEWTRGDGVAEGLGK